MKKAGRIESERPRFNKEINNLETYLEMLRPKDKFALETIILRDLNTVLPSDVRIFVVGSSLLYEDYRDIDLHIGATHELVPEIAALCHNVLEANPRITFQETTRDTDPTFTSPLPIGFSLTVDSPQKILTKTMAEEAFGLFDFAIPRYNLWNKLYTSKRALLIR